MTFVWYNSITKEREDYPMIKKIVIAVLVVTVVAFALGCLPYYTMRYCRVVSQEGNILTFVDNTGKEWMFKCADEERYTEGELLRAKMHDSWTEERYDDKVVSVERW